MKSRIEEELRRAAGTNHQQQEKNASDALPDIEDAAAFLEDETILDPPELVEGLIHQGAKVVVGGGSKSFKTWLLTELALCVAGGKDWLGFPSIAGRVLYINLEIQRPFFRHRIQAIAEARQMEVVADTLHVWNLRGHAADLDLLIAQILEKAGREKYALIVIDPIYKALGARDENKAGDIGSLLNQIERLAVQSGAAVVFGAHFSKGNQAGKEAIDRIGGSGVFARDPDSILVLTRHEQEEAFTVDATLRNHAPIAPFVVRWKFPLMHRDASLDPAKLKQVGGRAKEHDENELLEILAADELTMTEWQERAAKPDNGKISESTFYRLARKLKKANRVMQSKLDAKWHRSPC